MYLRGPRCPRFTEFATGSINGTATDLAADRFRPDQSVLPGLSRRHGRYDPLHRLGPPRRSETRRCQSGALLDAVDAGQPSRFSINSPSADGNSLGFWQCHATASIFLTKNRIEWCGNLPSIRVTAAARSSASHLACERRCSHWHDSARTIVEFKTCGKMPRSLCNSISIRRRT